jgi:flagellin-like hook-associated protein FlgL
MKINQLNVNSYLINTKPTNQIHSTSTNAISTTRNIMDSVRLSNLNGELRTNQAIQGNIQSGISLIQTMDASLSSGEELGLKLKELAVHYQSGVLSNEDKKMIEKEANELLKGLQKLFEETTFNGQKVFDKPNFSIYTGGSDSYKIETPKVSTIKEIKPIEINNNNESLKSSADSESQTLLSPMNLTVEQTTVLSLQPMTVSRTMAISAYKESSQLTSPSGTVSEKEVVASSGESEQTNEINQTNQVNQTTITTQSSQTVQTTATNQMTQTSNTTQSSNQERKDFTATMQDIFGSKKEARQFFGAKNDKEMIELAKKETTESLQQRFVDKGYGDKLDKAVEKGLFESLGLENPKKQEPTPTPNPSTPRDEPEVPTEGTSPGQTEGTENDSENGTEVGEGTGTESGEGTGSTEEPTSPEGNEEANTGGTGNNGDTGGVGDSEEVPTEPSIPTNPTNPTNPTVPEEDSSTEEGIPSTPSNPSKPPYEWNFADILKGDFIDKNILGVIKEGLSNLRIHEDILQSRMNFQERVEEISQDRIARLTQTDMAKTLMEEVKKQMLEQVKETLQVHQLDQQRDFILKLLQH